MDSAADPPCGGGCPIRRSSDQSLLAAPQGFSQRATSFIASWRQGIHQMPLLSSTPNSDNRKTTPRDLRSRGAPARRRTAPTKTGRRRSGHCCRKLIPATTTKPGCPPCRPEAARRQAYPCQNARPAQRRKDQEKGRNARLADARRTHDAQPMDRSTAMPAQRAPHHHLTMSKQHPANPALERASGRQAGFPSGTAGPQHRPTMAAALPSGGWWAWADLNGRPHAYQACALTS
jgi:hypothetical protein